MAISRCIYGRCIHNTVKKNNNKREGVLNQEHLSSSLQHLVERLACIPGVVAVSLGGSRARGEARPDSDWDFGLYYRGRINADDIRSLGFPGHVVEPGAWGRLVNGGGW